MPGQLGGSDTGGSQRSVRAPFQRCAARAGQQGAVRDRKADEAGQRRSPDEGSRERQAEEDEEDSMPLATFAELAIPRDFPSEDAPLGSWMILVIERQMRNMRGYPLLASTSLVPVGHEARQPEQQVQVDEDEVPLARLQELGMLAVPRKSTKSSSRGSRASGSGQ